jgi:fumarate reductase subunit C
MSTLRGKRRPYRRTMTGWWKRDRYYVRYLAMEGTSILIAIYAFDLLIGLYALGQGKTMYDLWLNAHRGPLAIIFNAALLAVFAYHTWTWFKVMPKTMPNVNIAGKRVSQQAIALAGVVVAVLTNLLVLATAAGLIR